MKSPDIPGRLRLGEIEGIDLTITHLEVKREQAMRLNRPQPIDLGMPEQPRPA
jgi:hypothetical protein